MLDFGAHPFIGIYVILLLISGIAMVVMSFMDRGGQKLGWRIFGGIAGVAFFAYGIYLGFFFSGGTFIISFKAVILPFVMIAGIIGRMRAGRGADAAAPQQTYLPQQQAQSGVQVPGMPYAAQPQVGQPPYGQAPPVGYGQQPMYGQAPVGQPPYGQAPPVGYGQQPQQPAGAYSQFPQYQPVQPPVQDAAPQTPQAPRDVAPPVPPAPQG